MSEENKQQLNTEKKGFKPQSIDSAMQTFAERDIPPDPKKKKNGWLGNLILIVVIAISIWLMLELGTSMGDGMKSFDEVIADMDVGCAFLALGVLIIIYTLESSKYATIISAVEGKPRWKESVKVMFLGKYYDNITPFASGGQPMQIHYLHKKGFSGGTSTAVIMIKYFANIFVWLTVALIFMVFHKDALVGLDTGMQDLLITGSWIGWGVNMLLPLFVVAFLCFPRSVTAMAKGIVRIGYKLKLVKDEEKAIGKAFKVVDDFKAALSIMIKRPFKLLLLLLLCVGEVLLVFALPYFVMRAFNGLTAADGIGAVWDVIALNVFASLAVTVAPTPGNSGFLETAITTAFSHIAKDVLFWVVITWRSMVYYIYIIIGIGITVFEMIRKNVRAKREKRQQELNYKQTE